MGMGNCLALVQHYYRVCRDDTKVDWPGTAAMLTRFRPRWAPLASVSFSLSPTTQTNTNTILCGNFRSQRQPKKKVHTALDIELLILWRVFYGRKWLAQYQHSVNGSAVKHLTSCWNRANASNCARGQLLVSFYYRNMDRTNFANL